MLKAIELKMNSYWRQRGFGDASELICNEFHSLRLKSARRCNERFSKQNIYETCYVLHRKASQQPLEAGAVALLARVSLCSSNAAEKCKFERVFIAIYAVDHLAKTLYDGLQKSSRRNLPFPLDMLVNMSAWSLNKFRFINKQEFVVRIEL